MVKRFYDIHYHLFDLSHPNLLAFVLRDELIDSSTTRKIVKSFPLILKLLPLWVVNLFPGKASQKIKDYIRNDAKNLRNLLSVIEGAIEYHFLYTEYFLLRDKKHFGDFPGAGYRKLAVCPLLMDFGYKNLGLDDCFYNLPPAKPVINQVVDLINAIWYYYNFDLIPHPDKQGRLRMIPASTHKDDKLFEIYPFLGLNTLNYDLPELSDLFDKYFRGYEHDNPGEARRRKIYDKLGTVKADFEDMLTRKKEKQQSDYYSYIFAGIKLYPPLGFDPWPDDRRELEKVRFLYHECVRKRLPLTVHCSGRGYVTSPQAKEFTDPSNKWKKVLERPEYRNLKINFAHLGTQFDGSEDWQKTIVSYIEGNKNIYTDCSCQTTEKDDYRKVARIMNSHTESNMLFGADYLINLIWSESYNKYLCNFISTPHLSDRQKELMCEINPEKFLFG
jgi:hypothetical protein